MRPSLSLFGLFAAPALLGLLLGCGESLTPLDQTLDFGDVFLRGEYTDGVALTNQLVVDQELVEARLDGGTHFQLLTSAPFVMGPEASYAIEFLFVTPEDEVGAIEDIARLTVARGDTRYEAVVRLVAWFEDGDLDGDGFITTELGGRDCDDAQSTVHPGADEVCDGLDNNCNDEMPDNEYDLDGDGWNRCSGDCDDEDAARFPGADEACDFIDTDCDGELGVDELDPDDDGYSACGGDCEPNVDFVHPGEHAEQCDGYDTNCDGVIPPTETDCD